MVTPQYIGIPLEELNPDNIARMVAHAGVVVIRDSGATPEEYAQWSLGLGYHLSPEIWCTDKEHSDLFWTVTNEMVDERNDYFQQQTDGQMSSVDNNLMRENDPRMPLFNDRKTKVTFGKGT